MRRRGVYTDAWCGLLLKRLSGGSGLALRGETAAGMKRYLVLDGYNPIGAVERYATRSTGSLDASRELLVGDALKAAGWTGQEITIVFDASHNPEPGRAELRAGGAVRVVYSAPNESADDAIERLVRSRSGSFTVCTA